MDKFQTLKSRLKDDDKIAWLEEKAAVREMDGGFDRDKAEELACEDWFNTGIEFFKTREVLNG